MLRRVCEWRKTACEGESRARTAEAEDAVELLGRVRRSRRWTRRKSKARETEGEWEGKGEEVEGCL
jgi:hypothetical protein